jgi:O-antigen ligase
MIYHYAVASGWMPAVFGGLFGNVALALALFCVPLAAWYLRPNVLGSLWQARLFVLAWTYFAVWAVAGTLTVFSDSHGALAAREAVTMLVFWAVMFFVGTFFQLDARLHRTALAIVCAAALALLVHAMIVHASLLGPFMTFNPESEESATYQGASRSILISGILFTALTRRHWAQLGALILTAAALLTLGSRTYLLASSWVFIMTALAVALKARRRTALVLVVVAAAVAIYVARTVFFATRAAELLDLGTSTSWQTRVQVQNAALDVIRHHPLVGDFAYHLRDFGPGSYSHNVLSAWTEFGILGFVLYCALIATFAFISIQGAVSNSLAATHWRTAAALNLAALVIIMAEPVFSVVPALAWGFTVNALVRDQRERRVAVLSG